MFDFFYVNKIETNLAVQSNSLHVKQKNSSPEEERTQVLLSFPLSPPLSNPL